MKIIQVPLDLIDIGERLRPVDNDYVSLIAESMRERGQDTPIRVTDADRTGRHRLIAGAHRVAAATDLNWKTIAAVAFSGDELEQEILQIDENLIRRELSDLDRAVFLARRKEIYEAQHPETKHGGARMSPSVATWAARFTLEVAEKIGMSERSVQRGVSIAKRIAPDVRTMIATTWLSNRGKELEALSRLPPMEQRSVARLMLRKADPLPSVSAALREVRNLPEPQVDEAEQQFQRLMKCWTDAGAAARRRFRAQLAEQDKQAPGGSASA